MILIPAWDMITRSTAGVAGTHIHKDDTRIATQ